MIEPATLINLGMFIAFLGFIAMAAGVMCSAMGNDRSQDQVITEGSVKSGGVILIGPFPIIFGSDKKMAIIAMILAIIIMALSIVFIRF